MKRIVLFEPHGALSCASVKINDMMDQYSKCNFSGYKFFLMAPGTQVPGHPIYPWVWNKVTKQFKMKNAPINTEFLDRLAEFAEAILGAGLDMCIIFDNRYFQRRWVKNHAFKRHPYRDNDCGVDYGGSAGQVNWSGQAKPIYDSITFPVKHHWKKWLDIDEKKLIFKFSDVDYFGAALSLLRSEVARILVPIVKQNSGRLFIIGRNEERAGEEGDRSELNVFEKECFEKAGVKKWGLRFHRIVNRDTDTFMPRLHPSVTGKYGVNGQLEALHEVHMGSNAAKGTMISQWGYSTAKTVWSSDGWKENQEPFVSGNRKLYLSGHHVSILFEEAVVPNPAPIHEMDKNLKAAAKVYEGITK